MKKTLISAIIPGYNEEKIIIDTISSVEKVLISLRKPFEIFIVDDGSTDNTSKILKKIVKSKKYNNLRFVTYKDGPSRRENLAKSFKFLKGKYILLLDMDLSMNPKHLKDMIHWLEHGYDMVIPNRYHSKSQIKRNLRRYIISKVYNAFIRILFRTGFKDNICGFKGFKKNIINQLVDETGIDETRKRSVFWDSELIIRALQNGISIKEIPVDWKEGKKSALSIKKEISMFPYMMKFWIRFQRNKIK